MYQFFQLKKSKAIITFILLWSSMFFNNFLAFKHANAGSFSELPKFILDWPVNFINSILNKVFLFIPFENPFFLVISSLIAVISLFLFVFYYYFIASFIVWAFKKVLKKSI
ncbi:hypothetical protein GF382_02220 [Candidatus Falkowbacteria bacterium]|nr:hypothetical protein [Candidatus Falkowbacteria bacterium]